MAQLYLELEITPHQATELLQRLDRDLDDKPACLADEVVVGVVGEVVHSRPMTKVDVVHHAQALEVVQEAVHG